MALSLSPSRMAYKVQQQGLRLPAHILQTVIRAVTNQPYEPSEEDIREVNMRFDALLERDLQNVEEGLYPKELLFQIPFQRYARQVPRLVLDVPRAILRKKKNAYQDLPESAEPRRYPAYFRRTFHWQTDGYLSSHSAELYDVSVEILFGGTADVMRRQVIPPITRFLRRRRSSEPARLLEIACGTGRTLNQTLTAHPELRATGLDISPYYLKEARKLLEDKADVSFVAENAEAMPFKDAHFDIVSNVYLFHELPKNARRNVAREMFRVLKPGGLLVVQDSCQLSDSPGLGTILENFSNDFHEPFYSDYTRDDLAEMFQEVGFEMQQEELHLMAKVVVLQKPELH